MRRILIVLFLLFSLLGWGKDHSKEPVYPSLPDDCEMKIEQLVDELIYFAKRNEEYVTEYKANVYTKAKVNILRKNFILRYLPTMFKIQRGTRSYLSETYSNLHFTAPNIYDHKITSSMGTMSEYNGMTGNLLEFFHINIYSSSYAKGKILSPLASNAKKYYNYRLDSVFVERGYKQYKISYSPKKESNQLLRGYLIMTDELCTVREMQFSGQTELIDFCSTIKLGEVGELSEVLPIHHKVDVLFKFIGNKVEASYLTDLEYSDIKREKEAIAQNGKSKYDLSDHYALQCIPDCVMNDSATFSSVRPIPLDSAERQIYSNYFLKADTLREQKLREKLARKKSVVFWGELGDALISKYTLNMEDFGSIRFSPLINPFLLSYSGTNGLSYKQKIKYNRMFKGNRLLKIEPRIGYNFKRSEWYWSVKGDFDYWPKKRAAWHFDIGNGNRIYGSDIIEELKQLPDSVVDFSKLNIDYYNDLHFHFRHSLELTNGLTLNLGVSTHRRTAVDGTDLSGLPEEEGGNLDGEDVKDKIRSKYISFAPRVSLTWTPGQYYYLSGNRKVNLHSKYPSITVDWERGLKGVLGSEGQHERVELDIQHKIPLSLMRTLSYRVGGGKFTNQDNLYFIDFANFAKNNLPVGWNDEIGGVFQLLDRRWYNASTYYMRGHFTYETPFLLLRHLGKYTRAVFTERIYVGVLKMDYLDPYIEVGYGVGTRIFDFGVFVSNSNWKDFDFGCKFTFELFSR